MSSIQDLLKRNKITKQNIQGISEEMKPKHLKDLRMYLGAVNELTQFILGLAQITEPYRDFLKQEGQRERKEKQGF